MTLDERILEESIDDLYEDAPCGYVSTLPDGTIVKVNRTFLTWTGYQREDLVGRKRFQNLLTIAGRIYHETHYAPLLYMQGFANEIALDLVRKDGARLPTLTNCVVKKDPAGHPVVNRITIFNATERREYERELLLARRKAEQLAKSKSDLLAMLSHEMRTPLGTIRMVSEILAKADMTPRLQRCVRMLKSASDNLLDLVNDILDLSKLEAGKMQLDLQSIDMRRLVEGVVETMRARTEDKGLILDIEIDERLPERLVGDAFKIRQVLTNLLTNAIKFTEQGRVTVSLRLQEVLAESVSVLFSVTDTGIGIQADRLSQVFEEYVQAGADITTRYGGTGLGLAICQKLVEVHGGTIHVKSVEGQGSTFAFHLRLDIPSAAAS